MHQFDIKIEESIVFFYRLINYYCSHHLSLYIFKLCNAADITEFLSNINEASIIRSKSVTVMILGKNLLNMA